MADLILGSTTAISESGGALTFSANPTITLGNNSTFPSGHVIGSKMTMVRDKKSLSLTADTWAQLTWLNVDYQAVKITSNILITLTINAMGFHGGTTQAWRFTADGTLANNAGTHTDGSDLAHGSTQDYGLSDGNHTKILVLIANLGNPSTVASAITYGVQIGPQSGGTAYFGADAGNHSGPIVGCPSPSFLRVEEIAV